MRIVLACPTIAARPGLAEQTINEWKRLTPGHDLTAIISTAGTTWGDGLNDAYEQVRDDPPDLFIAGSDDMRPTAGWLDAIIPWLERGCFPVPRVSDPRFDNHGSIHGPHVIVDDGEPADMSTFPLIPGHLLDTVFPLPEGLHYFADSMISALIHLAGVKAVAVPSCRILHMHAMEGRGAGYGSENNRLYIDTVRYSRALEARGIDRLALPRNLKGHMWEENYLAIGREMESQVRPVPTVEFTA